MGASRGQKIVSRALGILLGPLFVTVMVVVNVLLEGAKSEASITSGFVSPNTIESGVTDLYTITTSNYSNVLYTHMTNTVL